MSFNPSWQAGKTGMHPIPADKAWCCYCKGEIRKLHGLNQNRPQDRNQPTVMAFFLFGAGPFCLHCAEKRWTDPEFFRRSGSSEYSANRWNLERI